MELTPAQVAVKVAIKDACLRTDRTLRKMHSSDLGGDTSGLNECGLKMAFLAAIDEVPDVEIFSEHHLEGKRADIVLSHGKEMFAVVLEFKYVRSGFMAIASWNSKDSLAERFRKLNAVGARLTALKWDSIESLTYRDPSTGKQATMKSTVSGAIVQADEYARLLKVGNVGALRYGGKRITTVMTGVVIGVGSRCFFRAS